MSDYWKNRIADEERRWQRLAGIYQKESKTYYTKAIKRIENELNALYAEILENGGENLTRSQLWSYQHYRGLINEINRASSTVGVHQISMLDELLEKVFRETIGHSPNYATNVLYDTLTRQVITSTWSGANYSDRVWNNTQALAKHLKQDVEDMITLGKMPGEIKKQIIRDFGVSYNEANRLVRTETAHVFSDASLQRYKTASVKKVEILVEDDACEDCLKLEGKQFDINAVPLIPIHPNCRCCYIPVISEDTTNLII